MITPGTSSTSSLDDLARQALNLAKAARLPAVMLVAEPYLPTPIDSRTEHCQPILTLGLDEALVYGDLDSRAGQVAAGAMAHQLACHQLPVTLVSLVAGRALSMAFLGILAAAVLSGLDPSWPPWPTAALAALGVVALVLRNLAEGVREVYADELAASLLNEAGADGRTCIFAMLSQLRTTETRWSRIARWLADGHPTASIRVRAFARTANSSPAPAAAPKEEGTT